MRVPDKVLKCVGFIGEVTFEDSEGLQGELCATGFFVSVPCESQQLREMRFVYFVTAKHVATDLNGRRIYFLVNGRDGGLTFISGIVGQDWYLHPTDETADVAVVQVLTEPSADVLAISIGDFGLPEKLKRLDIGIGDEVFMTGLFTAVPGQTRNMPIVRHGNIAMMPEEQIQTELGYADVYLVEARSIGGLSGSPVFVRHTLGMKVKVGDDRSDIMFGNGPGVTLLGLMHGHWDIREADLNNPNISQSRKHGVNLGVGIVVPANKIYETLYQSELVGMRKNDEMEILRASVPGTDLARKTDDCDVFTRQAFEDALRKASRKKSDET